MAVSALHGDRAGNCGRDGSQGEEEGIQMNRWCSEPPVVLKAENGDILATGRGTVADVIESLSAPDADLQTVVVEGRKGKRIEIARRSLNNTVFSGAKLKHVSISNSCSRGSDWSFASFSDDWLDYASLSSCDFQESTFTNSSMDQTLFGLCDMTGTWFRKSRISSSAFTSCFSGTPVLFDSCDVAGLSIERFLGGILVKNCKMTGFALSFFHMRGTDSEFENWELLPSTIVRSAIKDGTFRGVRFHNVKFVSVDFSNVIFKRAWFANVVFRLCRFKDTYAISCSEEQPGSIVFDNCTGNLVPLQPAREAEVER